MRASSSAPSDSTPHSGSVGMSPSPSPPVTGAGSSAAVVVLLVVSDSGRSETTVALRLTGANRLSTCNVIANWVCAPTAISLALQTTDAACAVHPAGTLTTDRPAGSATVAVTPVADCGPAFATVSV